MCLSRVVSVLGTCAMCPKSHNGTSIEYLAWVRQPKRLRHLTLSLAAVSDMQRLNALSDAPLDAAEIRAGTWLTSWGTHPLRGDGGGGEPD